MVCHPSLNCWAVCREEPCASQNSHRNRSTGDLLLVNYSNTERKKPDYPHYCFMKVKRTNRLCSCPPSNPPPLPPWLAVPGVIVQRKQLSWPRRNSEKPPPGPLPHLPPSVWKLHLSSGSCTLILVQLSTEQRSENFHVCCCIHLNALLLTTKLLIFEGRKNTNKAYNNKP